jgi:hypothetical protein
MGRHWLKHNWLVATIAFVQQGKILGRGDLLTITSGRHLNYQVHHWAAARNKAASDGFCAEVFCRRQAGGDISY